MEGYTMKRMVLYFIVLLALTAGAQAHDGSIGIYTSTLGEDCDCDIDPYQFFPLYIVYFKSDGGLDGICGAEFKLEKSEPVNLSINSFTPIPGALTIGSIEEGISVTFACTGNGADYVHIGTIEVFSVAVFDWTLHIVEDPFPTIGPGIYVLECNEDKTMVPVLGGWFHEGEGNCEIAAESTTWGAIKSIYAE